MTDGQLAVIGVGSIGSMALWQASQHSPSVVGFESKSPAHPRSAVGGDSRLFRMTYTGKYGYYPILQSAQRFWRELESVSGHDILTQCGGLSIGFPDGPLIPDILRVAEATRPSSVQVLDRTQMADRYPQHRLQEGEIGVFDPDAGFLRTDRAVLSAVEVAQANGAQLERDCPIDEVLDIGNCVRVSSGARSWTFDRVIVSAGGWSGELLPDALRASVYPKRIYLTWFAARKPADFTPDKFPIFGHIAGRRSMYGTPTLDGSTIKAVLADRSIPAESADSLDRMLTTAEIAEAQETVADFFPGVIPDIVRSDTYPDLYTVDRVPILGPTPASSRIYYATGFSGIGFKMSSAAGAIAASEALGLPSAVATSDLDFVRPTRFRKTGASGGMAPPGTGLPA